MKARLIRDDSGIVKLLCADGSIHITDYSTLRLLLIDFKNINSFTGTDGNWSSTSIDMAMHPGETLAYVSDDLSLVIFDSAELVSSLSSAPFDSYISIPEYAKKVDKSIESIKLLCREGRLRGATKVKGRWLIPENTPYPIKKPRQRKSN